MELGGRHVYDKLFVHETLLDLALEMLEGSEGSSSFRGLMAVKSQLETVANVVQLVPSLSQQELLSVRLFRLRTSVDARLRNQDVNTVNEPYENAAIVWRSGVHRYDRLEKLPDRSKRREREYKNRKVLGELSQ